MTLQDLGMGLLRQLLWERCQGECGICHEPVRVEQVSIDHIVPRKHGGTDELANLQAAHLVCNLRKGTRDKPKDRPIVQLRMRLPLRAVAPTQRYTKPRPKPFVPALPKINLPDLLTVSEIAERLDVSFDEAVQRIQNANVSVLIFVNHRETNRRMWRIPVDDPNLELVWA